MADRTVVMDTGRIAQIGTARELYDRPASRFVAEFIGRMNVLPVAEGRLGGRRLALPQGAERATLIGIRPEDVRVHTGVEPQGREILPASLRNTIYLGNLAHLVLDVEGVGHEIIAEVPGHACRAIAEAARIGVELPAETVKVLA